MNTSVLPSNAKGVNSNSLSFSKLFLRCLLFVIAFALITSASILICSAIFYNTTNPTSKIELASLISLYFSTFLSSMILTKINGEKWLFGGIILGFLIYLITLALALLIQDEPNPKNIAFRLLIILVSIFSAFLARKREKKRRMHKIKK